MTDYQPPRIIRRERTGSVIRYLRCEHCGYSSGKRSFPADVEWEGAECPECGKRLRASGVNRT